MKKVIVTGATGFIGEALCEELIKRNYEVIAIVRNMSKVSEVWKNRVHYVVCELENIQEIDKKIEDRDIDIFFHFGWDGLTEPKRSNIDIQLNNVKNAYQALMSAKKIGCRRFVYAGSIMEYEAIHDLASTSEMTGMGKLYAGAKMYADYVCKTKSRELQIEYITLIISNIYGPTDKSRRFINSTADKMLKNEDIKLSSCEQMYDFIYIKDAVSQMLAVAERGKDLERYYIGNSKPRRLKEFVFAMKKVLNSSSELHFGAIERKGSDLNYEELDTNKVGRELGIQPTVDFETGIGYLKTEKLCILEKMEKFTDW